MFCSRCGLYVTQTDLIDHVLDHLEQAMTQPASPLAIAALATQINDFVPQVQSLSQSQDLTPIAEAVAALSAVLNPQPEPSA